MAAAALIWPALRQRPPGLARQRRAGRPAADGAQAGAGLILTGSRHAFGAADMTPGTGCMWCSRYQSTFGAGRHAAAAIATTVAWHRSRIKTRR
jgi:hypothetical protein